MRQAGLAGLAARRWKKTTIPDPAAARADRIPCATFQGWLERDGWVKRFPEAALPGAFLGVIARGDIRAGDPVDITHGPTTR